MDFWFWYRGWDSAPHTLEKKLYPYYIFNIPKILSLQLKKYKLKKKMKTLSKNQPILHCSCWKRSSPTLPWVSLSPVKKQASLLLPKSSLTIAGLHHLRLHCQNRASPLLVFVVFVFTAEIELSTSHNWASPQLLVKLWL